MPAFRLAEPVSHVTIHRNSHMSKAAIEVITSVQRRRRWSTAEKERLVAGSLGAGRGGSPGAATPAWERAGIIEIEFSAGGRVRITGPVEASTVLAVMRALAKSKRRRCSRCRAERAFGG